ncbi:MULTISPECIES: shikimate kinase [Chryseobacterium]|uniref:Shikimate kinase n=1 Tax=Chryseobacterium camelliae TaxID=1265445 RepID=A0ABU0TDB0_9FLAO|nr:MULTISPECIES: shikimate kinase [Chryseobacterium]MDT3407156.1 shikimate kinase [Pseudacidovorax intermedius]MDQ1095053.1 shikimate kinase [Chryseobacterium camelliae]MDQ1098992.1 shikimate kinase [Chryseobacterium sp. SORGH_AS_1048]MDR6086340.1 shikimate kinase [Chryseobacterium sp. SORGH_AS_0909]MDR6130712.1 shikimate kinase [Chryseobacterium sp. SORGH_AS_1175]
MIISLVGYMGSGKSHISKILSEKLDFRLIDLDKEISKRNKLAVPEIFEKKGEIYFRKQEREILEEILATEENSILSLGGGTPVYYNNMEIINHNSKSIFLKASVATLSERLLKQKDKRPLIARIADEDLPEFIAKHLFERNEFYSKSQFSVSTDARSPEDIVEEIIEKLYH